MEQFFSDAQRKPGIGVNRTVVLHIGIVADIDELVVAAQHRAEPDARVRAESNVADHLSAAGDVVLSVRRKLWRTPVQFINCHASLSSDLRRSHLP